MASTEIKQARATTDSARALESIAQSMKQMAKSMDNIMHVFVQVGRMIADNLEEESKQRNPNQGELFDDERIL